MVSLGELLARQQQEKSRSLSTAVQAQGVGFEIEKQRQAQIDAEKKAERESAFNPVLSLAGAIAGGLTGGVGGAVLGLGQGIGAGERTTLEKAIGSSVGGYGAGKLFAEPTAQQKTLAALTGQSTPSLSPQDLVQLGTGAMGGTQGIAQAVGGIATRRKTNEEQNLKNLLTKAQIGKLESETDKTLKPKISKVIKIGGRQIGIDEQGNEVKDLGADVSSKTINMANQGLYSVDAMDKIMFDKYRDKETGKIDYGKIDPLEWQKTIGSSKVGLFATQKGRLIRSSLVNAVDVILRERTGARINKEEFDQAMQAWGIQLGDSPAVVAKKQNDLRMMYRLMKGDLQPGTPEYEKANQLSFDLIDKVSQYTDLVAQTQTQALEMLRGRPKGSRIWVEELNDFLEVD